MINFIKEVGKQSLMARTVGNVLFQDQRNINGI